MDRMRITTSKTSMVLQGLLGGRFLGSDEISAAKKLVSGRRTIGELEAEAARRRPPKEQIILKFPGITPEES